MFMNVRREDHRSFLSFDDFDDFEYGIANGWSSDSQDLHLKFYDVNMAYIGEVHLLFYNLYEHIVKNHFMIKYDEPSPMNLNYIVDSLKGGDLIPEDLSPRPYICAYDILEIAPEFEGTGVNDLIIQNIAEIAEFYNTIKIFGVIAFPGDTGETTMVNGEWNFDKDSFYLDELSLFERNGFSRIGDSEYFFKECKDGHK